MSKITKKQFLADVRHEIDMLKLHTTDEERGRLDFETFDYSNERRCIYGQITGNCRNSRAVELIGICCIRLVQFRNYNNRVPLSGILPMVNGENKGQININPWLYFSAIEGYVYATNAKNKQIIAYIKGEIETLAL